MMRVQNPFFLKVFLFYSEGGVAFSSGFGKSFACTLLGEKRRYPTHDKYM